MILFIGDAPSSSNLDPKVAFVGTQSYVRLCSWIPRLNLSLNDVVLCNKDDIETASETPGTCHVPDLDLRFDPNKGDRIVALGRNVEKRLKELGLQHYYLPHPSPSNRIYNNPLSEDQLLKELKTWLSR